MTPRDLFLGLFLIGGSVWILATEPTFTAGAAGVTLLFCILSGVAYLVSSAVADRDVEVGGVGLTRSRCRAVAQALLGVAMVTIGAFGIAGDTVVSVVVAGVGLLALAIAYWLWRDGDLESGGNH